MWTGHGWKICEWECRPCVEWFRVGKVKVHFVSGDCVGESVDRLKGRLGRWQQPEPLPHRTRGFDQINIAATNADGPPVRYACDGFFRGLLREECGILRLTKTRDRTCGAIRLPGTTDHGPQIHESGGVVASACLREKRGRSLLQKKPPGRAGDIFTEIEKPGNDALDIGIQNRNGSVESEGDNCRGRIGSDPRERTQAREITGNHPSEPGNDRLCCAMQIASPRVVAEPFPVFHDLLLRCRGEGRNIGKFLHPSLKIRLHSGNRCLLKHEFGNENRIGRRIRPPRQNAALGLKPFLERFIEMGCCIFV